MPNITSTPFAASSSPMGATDLNVYRPNIWTKELLLAREKLLVMAPRIRRYDRDIKTAGKTVEIPNLSNLAATAKAEASPVKIVTAGTEQKTTITLDQHYEASFLMEDYVDIQSAYDAAAAYVEKAAYAIAEQIDTSIITEMTSGITQLAETAAAAGNTALTDSRILKAVKLLDDAKAPGTERTFVVGPKGKSELLGIDKFVRYDALGTGAAIENGKIGNIYGMEVVLTHNLVTTTVSTIANTTTNFIFHKDVCALALQKDVTMESQRLTQYLGTLYVTHAIWGVKTLRDTHGVKVFN